MPGPHAWRAGVNPAGALPVVPRAGSVARPQLSVAVGGLDTARRAQMESLTGSVEACLANLRSLALGVAGAVATDTTGKPAGASDTPAGAWADTPAGDSADTPAVGAHAAALVDLIASLEALKAAASAAQARLQVDLASAQQADDAAAGRSVERQGTAVGAQVALARSESPHRGGTLLGAAHVWTTEMPYTFAALAAGRLSEYRATLLVQHTAALPLEARSEVDELVCADPRTLEGIGTRRLVALVQGHAARLDPASVAARARRAAAERTVTLRPAPDTMTYLTALLPAAQGVAALALLQRAAAAARAGGDSRSRGQVMADTLVERVTGQPRAEAVPVAVTLVLSDATLLGAGHDDAVLDGHGRVPAQVARNLVAHGLDARAAWLSKVYADPDGDLVALTSARRFHPDGLASMLRVRDQGLCRTPYCDAPIRHLDHVQPHADGGATDLANGQGLCEACNHVKQSPGWEQHVEKTRRGVREERIGRNRVGGPPAGPLTTRTAERHRHRVRTTTPTGHQYVSSAPEPPRPLPSRGPSTTTLPWPAADWSSPVDVAFAEIVRRLAPRDTDHGGDPSMQRT